MSKQSDNAMHRHFVEHGSFRMAETEITDACITRVSVATNGFHGGDAGHGGKAVFSLADMGGTALEAHVDWCGGPYNSNDCSRVDIVAMGDAEIRMLASALRFAADELDSMLKPVNGIDDDKEG